MASSQQDIVEEIISSMYAYSQQIPTCSTLGNIIGATDLTVPFDATVSIPRGLAEIGDELVFVMGSDPTGGEFSVAPWGRGYAGTDAATHAAGSRITVAPLFPRKRVNDIINQVIGKLDTALSAINEYEFTPSTPIRAYTLPVGIESVLSAAQQTYGPSLEWEPIPRFFVDLRANASFSGRSITFHQALRPGRPVKLVTAMGLTPIGPGDMLADSGLDESQRDLVVMGAQVKLLMTQDFGRLQSQSVESAAREGVVPITSASTIANRLNAQFEQRVIDEAAQQMQLYPTRLARFS